MSGLLIAGAGGHGKVLAETAIAMGRWDRIAFVDDRFELLQADVTEPILGRLDEAVRWKHHYSDIVVAIGDAKVRLRWMDRFAEQGFGLPILQHPGSWLSPSAQLGEGSVILAQAVVNARAVLGRGCIINTAATVDHDCVLGDGVHVCPGAHLAGEVRVGRASWIGIGANVIQQRRIGEGVMVGAGAVVIDDIGDDATVVGVPAREVVRRDAR